MPKQRKKPYLRKRLMKFSKGSMSFGFFILFAVITVFGGVFFLKPPPSKNPNPTQGYVLVTEAPEPSRPNLQLKTIAFITVTPGPLPPNCSSVVSDTALIIDHSSTMVGTKLFKAKEAAKLFLDIVSTNPSSRVGLVSFSKFGTLLSGLTSDFVALKPLIDGIPESKNTCIQCGAKVGNDMMQAQARPDVKKAAVLLSDGKANHINGVVDKANAVQAALDEVASGHSISGTVYYTIGFGDGVNAMMQQAATLTGGTYHFAPTENELAAVFLQIASSICQ